MGMNTRSGVPALGERSAVVVTADLLSGAPAPVTLAAVNPPSPEASVRSLAEMSVGRSLLDNGNRVLPHPDYRIAELRYSPFPCAERAPSRGQY